MMGGAINKPAADKTVIVRHTEEVVATTGGVVPLPKDHITGETYSAIAASDDHPIRLLNLTTGTRTQIVSDTYDGTKAFNFKNPAMLGNDTPVKSKAGDHIRVFWEEVVTGDANADAAVEVTISPDTFPGTYRVVGDTFMRSQATGKDEAFQFVIGKAKVLSEVTITLEAEGDPSTFEMTLNVLRSENERGEKEMMKLIRYGGTTTSANTSGNDQGSIVSGGSSGN